MDFNNGAARQRFLDEAIARGPLKIGQNSMERFGFNRDMAVRISHRLGVSEENLEKGKVRNCMCCRHPFLSWGAGNRLCGWCKANAD